MFYKITFNLEACLDIAPTKALHCFYFLQILGKILIFSIFYRDLEIYILIVDHLQNFPLNLTSCEVYFCIKMCSV